MATGMTAQAVLPKGMTAARWAAKHGVPASAVQQSGNHVWTYATSGTKGPTAQQVLPKGMTSAQWATAIGAPSGSVFSGNGHVWTYAKLTPPLNQMQQSVFDLMNKTLQDWGLGSLATDLKNLILKGDTSPDTLALALSQTDTYKKRFAANEQRKANGLPELTPAQYIGTEEQYKQILQQYGLPKGFYDQQSDFTNFLANDLSPAELDARAKIAETQYQNAPAYMKELWGQYGFSKGDAIAGILDPKTATAVIQNRATQVAIGGAAAARGLSVSQQRAQQFQQAGVTQQAADQAYSKISEILPIDQQIAQRFGTTFGQTQEENDLLLGQGQAAAQRRQLYSEEQGLFRTNPGTTGESLGVSQQY